MLLAILTAPVEARAHQADTAAPLSDAATRNSTIVSLLEQSHELDQQFSPSVHLDLLSRQASLVSQIPGERSSELTRFWADELFALSAQVQQPRRSALQSSALSILARLDPPRALELLRTAQWPESGPPSPKRQLAQRVFSVLVNSDGVNALPLLQQEADRMGQEGQYPYAALGMAASYAVAKDWGVNPQHARAVLRSVFEPAFARYSQSSPDYPNDYDFGEMLKFVAGGLPFEVIQPALRTLVKNLLAADTGKYHFQAHALRSDGEDLQADNAIDAALAWFGSLINRDPELVQQLEDARPQLVPILECYKTNLCRGGSFGRVGAVQKPRVIDRDAETRAAALRLSHTDPDLAISKVESLPDDGKRAATTLEVARGVAGNHPEQAAQLIDRTQGTMGSEDQGKQLNLISAQVSVAAAQNQQEEVRRLLQRGFALAGPLISESQAPLVLSFASGLMPMVQIGAQNDPDLTIAFLQSLPPLRIKAELLLAAATAMQMPVKLPIGSRKPTANPLTSPVGKP